MRRSFSRALCSSPSRSCEGIAAEIFTTVAAIGFELPIAGGARALRLYWVHRLAAKDPHVLGLERANPGDAGSTPH